MFLGKKMSNLYSDHVKEVKRKSDRDVFLILFKAIPCEDNEEFGKLGGAYVSCWVNAETLKEAEVLALESIEKEKWKPEKLENWELVNEETYTEDSELSEEEAEEYRDCLLNALEHGITLSFHCWPIDVGEKDIRP